MPLGMEKQSEMFRHIFVGDGDGNQQTCPHTTAGVNDLKHFESFCPFTQSSNSEDKSAPLAKITCTCPSSKGEWSV